VEAEPSDALRRARQRLLGFTCRTIEFGRH
jgi:hypothetical protein